MGLGEPGLPSGLEGKRQVETPEVFPPLAGLSDPRRTTVGSGKGDGRIERGVRVAPDDHVDSWDGLGEAPILGVADVGDGYDHVGSALPELLHHATRRLHLVAEGHTGAGVRKNRRLLGREAEDPYAHVFQIPNGAGVDLPGVVLLRRRGDDGDLVRNHLGELRVGLDGEVCGEDRERECADERREHVLSAVELVVSEDEEVVAHAVHELGVGESPVVRRVERPRKDVPRVHEKDALSEASASRRISAILVPRAGAFSRCPWVSFVCRRMRSGGA